MRCRNCKKKVSEFARECPYCHTAVQGTEGAMERYLNKVHIAAAREEERWERKKNKKPFKLMKQTYLSIAAMMAAVLLLGNTYYIKLNAWEQADLTYAYLSGDELLVGNTVDGKQESLCRVSINDDMEEEWKECIYSEESALYHKDEANGRFYYGDSSLADVEEYAECFSLYCKNMKNMKSSPKLITEQGICAQYDASGNVYYVERKAEEVIKYNGSKKTSIALSGIERLYYNEKYNIMFAIQSDVVRTYDSSGNEATWSNVYRIDLETLAVKKIFRMEYWSMQMLKNQKEVVYLCDNILSVYEIENDRTNELARNVLQVGADALNENGLYYVQYVLEKHSLYDFVIDPYVGQDENKDTRDEYTNIRNCVRRMLKDTIRYLGRPKLCYYQSGKTTQIYKDVGHIGYLWGVGEEVADSASKMGQIDVKYKLSENGTDSISEIDDFYTMGGDDNERTETCVDSYICYNYEDADDLLETCTAWFAYEKDTYSLENQEMVPEEGNEEKRNPYYTRTENGITYYYDLEEECLMKVMDEKTNQAEEVSRNVFSYCVLKDGTLLYLTRKMGEREYFLYQITKEGKKTLVSENAWGLFGNDVCLIRESYELQ